MADISQVTINDTTYDIKDATARGAILEPLIGSSADVTPTQVATAVAEGRTVAISHPVFVFGTAVFANFGYSIGANIVVSTTMLYQNSQLLTFQLIGNVSSDTWTIQMGAMYVYPTVDTSVTDPTISCTPTTTSVYSITDAGSLPTLTDSVTNETLSFSWSQGTLPTKGSAQTVMTGVSATASGTSVYAELNSGLVQLMFD